MTRYWRWLMAVMIALPVPAAAQGTRPDAVSATPVPTPPRRPTSLPRGQPVGKPGERPVVTGPPVVQPKTTPVEAAKPVESKPVEFKPGGAATLEGSVGGGGLAQPPSLSCTAGLSVSHGDGVTALDPVKLHAALERACHVEEPVLVRGLMVQHNGVSRPLAFDPPVTMACDLAASLSRWAQTGLLPLATGHFSRRVTRLRVGGGHECRRRNRSATGPLSEHSTGRALDIFAFVLDGEPATGEVKIAGSDAAARGRPGGGPKTDISISVEKPTGAQELAFLEAVRQSACGAFMTVLGPGSDAAHANHIHLDIQARRSGASRFCQ